MLKTILLPNGVRLLCEPVDSVRSVTLGIWVGTGSRFESAAENGCSHFLEHMLFKGTATRSAEALARESDALGGQVNAFTTKEYTCYYGRVLDSHLPLLTDILCDMFFHSLFREEDVESERRVILEEMDMYKDDPEDLVHEQLFLKAFAGHGLARPVLGTEKSLRSLTAEKLKAYYSAHYNGATVVVALSGSFREEDIAELSRRFAALPTGKPQPLRKAAYRPSLVLLNKETEQNHLVLAYPCIPTRHEKRYAFSLLSAILGGSASSRLFQSVREKHGLCYGISSGNFSYLKEGLYTIHTALSRETEEEAIRLILEELDRLKSGGVTEEELFIAREQTKANILMALESTVSRMNHLGRGTVQNDTLADPDSICAALDGVTQEEIRLLACQWLDNRQLSFSAVGQLQDGSHYREVLGC